MTLQCLQTSAAVKIIGHDVFVVKYRLCVGNSALTVDKD